MNIVYIDINQLEELEINSNVIPNNVFEKIVQDIKQYGIVYPIIVTSANNGKYKIIDGHHRVKAAKILNINKVPCIITNIPIEQAELRSVQLNTERGEQNPKLLASILDKYKDKVNLEQELVYDNSLIQDLLELVKLEDNIDKLTLQQQEEIDYIMYNFIIPKQYQQDVDEVLNMFNSPKEALVNLCLMAKSMLKNNKHQQ